MKTVLKKSSLAFVVAVVTVASFAGSPVRADSSPKIGSGSRACLLAADADCDGVVLKGKLSFHGDASGVSLVGARLNGANLSGANLAKADLRGAGSQILNDFFEECLESHPGLCGHLLMFRRGSQLCRPH